MINSNPETFVGQGVESYSSLDLLYDGAAKQETPKFPGDIRFLFPTTEGNKLVVFDWVSSVMYCDELLWSDVNYPYCKDKSYQGGLYEVKGSSYLKRVQAIWNESPLVFSDHHHYVYFDREFNWHITARGLEEEEAE